MKTILFLSLALIFNLSVFIGQNNAQTAGKSGVVILEMHNRAILGGVRNGKFVDPKTASADFKTGENYKLFGLGRNANVLRTKEVIYDERCEWYPVRTYGEADAGVALSPNVGWNPVPRKPVSLDPGSRVYQGVVSRFLQSRGIAKPVVKIEKILRVDLDGDGQDEVLIYASRDDSTDLNDSEMDAENYYTLKIRKGSYSFLLLRKIVRGKVKDILIDGQFYAKDQKTMMWTLPKYEISSILDLNGDGTMEIVVYSTYYESAGSTAYQIADGKAVAVLETGCGA